MTSQSAELVIVCSHPAHGGKLHAAQDDGNFLYAGVIRCPRTTNLPLYGRSQIKEEAEASSFLRRLSAYLASKIRSMRRSGS
ncbi:hypothetical protein, partial [Comamonas sp.]|uniref:hypothetical protein n=1 Tax=Comamonas sp. TaxID=34028 RepID=UPI002FC70ABF